MCRTSKNCSGGRLYSILYYIYIVNCIPSNIFTIHLFHKTGFFSMKSIFEAFQVTRWLLFWVFLSTAVCKSLCTPGHLQMLIFFYQQYTQPLQQKMNFHPHEALKYSDVMLQKPELAWLHLITLPRRSAASRSSRLLSVSTRIYFALELLFLMTIFDLRPK